MYVCASWLARLPPFRIAAVTEGLLKKIVQESSALTLEAGLGAALAILASTDGAHKVRQGFQTIQIFICHRMLLLVCVHDVLFCWCLWVVFVM